VPAHIHPTPFRFAHGPVSLQGSASLGSASKCSLSCRNHQVPRAPLPLAGVTCSGETRRPIRGRYPSFLALTGSCARPPSSLLLGSRLVRRVFAGCRQSLLGDGPSRRYLHGPCVGAWTPTPPCSTGALARSLPDRHRPYLRMNRFGARDLPRRGFSVGFAFRGCSHSLMFRLPHSLGPLTAPTAEVGTSGRLGRLHHAMHERLPARAVASLRV